MPDEHAGKRAKCPACGVVTPIPVATGTGPIEVDEREGPDEDLSSRLKRTAPAAATNIVRPPPGPAMLYPSKTPAQRVVVVDFDMPFASLVGLMVKVAFAAIPAILIVWIVSGGIVLALALVVSLFGGNRFQ